MGMKKSSIKDQYTVVLEGIRSDFRAFAEALGILQSDVSGLREDVSDLSTRMGHLETDMVYVKSELSSIHHSVVPNNKFVLLEARVSRLERKAK